MIKRIICVICTIMLCCGMIPAKCDAAVLDINQSCSLTLSYTRNGNAFSSLDIDIYRVAELSDNGKYMLLEPFSNYPIKIHGITSQKEWRDTAQTIRNYVAANQIKAYRSQKTDENGCVYFDKLEAGLYMVKGTKVRNSDGTVTFQDFMISVPNPVNGVYNYDVEAKPKSSVHTPSAPNYEKYTVIKLWQDAADSTHRPESVLVEILRDGVLYKTVVLDSSNNWSYSWETMNNAANWSVIEQDVPDGYVVSVINSMNTFTITNVRLTENPDKPGDPDTPVTPGTPDAPIIIPGQPLEDIPDPKTPLGDAPKTGDTAPLLLYVIALCVSGVALILLSVLRLKEGKHEKKR